MPELAPTPAAPPTAFISYSWTTAAFCERVREWADRLMTEGGVNVILDRYDLKEGHDKNAFMERMVTDKTVSHVLIFSDKRYAEKADGRQGGVGAESMIISQKVYSMAKQSKFIPIFCEKDEHGEPYVPVFMAGRIGFDFSSVEKENENWEPLIRALHGRPIHQKPQIGKPPAYILADHALPSLPATGKFATLKQAILTGRGPLGLYRNDFLDACIQFADSLRVREGANSPVSAEKVLEDFVTLVPVRNALTDWVLLEASANPTAEFSDALSILLEKLLEIAARPKEASAWIPGNFAAASAFVCETVLYLVAALLKKGAYGELHNVLTSSYLIPESEVRSDKRFQSFDGFLGGCGTVGQILKAPNGADWLSPTAALFKREATRSDIGFAALMEADVLIYMVSVLHNDGRWVPQTFVYCEWSTTFPLFVRATQHKGFLKLAQVTGIADAVELREKITAYFDKNKPGVAFGYGWSSEVSLATAMNLDKLDTVA